jgi:hypothetical protein
MAAVQCSLLRAGWASDRWRRCCRMDSRAMTTSAGRARKRSARPTRMRNMLHTHPTRVCHSLHWSSSACVPAIIAAAAATASVHRKQPAATAAHGAAARISRSEAMCLSSSSPGRVCVRESVCVSAVQCRASEESDASIRGLHEVAHAYFFTFKTRIERSSKRVRTESMLPESAHWSIVCADVDCLLLCFVFVLLWLLFEV